MTDSLSRVRRSTGLSRRVDLRDDGRLGRLEAQHVGELRFQRSQTYFLYGGRRSAANKPRISSLRILEMLMAYRNMMSDLLWMYVVSFASRKEWNQTHTSVLSPKLQRHALVRAVAQEVEDARKDLRSDGVVPRSKNGGTEALLLQSRGERGQEKNPGRSSKGTHVDLTQRNAMERDLRKHALDADRGRERIGEREGRGRQPRGGDVKGESKGGAGDEVASGERRNGRRKRNRREGSFERVDRRCFRVPLFSCQRSAAGKGSGAELTKMIVSEETFWM